MAIPLVRIEYDALLISADATEKLGAQTTVAIARGVNHTLDRAGTAVERSLRQQTGISLQGVKKHVRRYYATPQHLVADLHGRGGFTNLKDFQAKQLRKGVRARPWGQSRFFPGAFIVPSLGGQVFHRVGFTVATRGRATKGKHAGKSYMRERIERMFGPSVPVEMVRGEVPKVFDEVANARMPERIAHEVEVLLKNWSRERSRQRTSRRRPRR